MGTKKLTPEEIEQFEREMERKIAEQRAAGFTPDHNDRCPDCARFYCTCPE